MKVREHENQPDANIKALNIVLIERHGFAQELPFFIK